MVVMDVRPTNGRGFSVPNQPLNGDGQLSATMGSRKSHQIRRNGKLCPLSESESVTWQASPVEVLWASLVDSFVEDALCETVKPKTRSQDCNRVNQ
jgi:hypothetical protein